MSGAYPRFSEKEHIATKIGGTPKKRTKYTHSDNNESRAGDAHNPLSLPGSANATFIFVQ